MTVVLIDVVLLKERSVSAVGLVFVGRGDVISGSVVSTMRPARCLGENVGGLGRTLGVLTDFSVSSARKSSHTSSVKYSGSGVVISLFLYS